MPKIYFDKSLTGDVHTVEEIRALVEENVVVQVDPVTHHSYLWIDDEVVHRGGEDGLGRAFIAWGETL